MEPDWVPTHIKYAQLEVNFLHAAMYEWCNNIYSSSIVESNVIYKYDSNICIICTQVIDPPNTFNWFA